MMEQQVDHYNPAELTNEKKENISLGIIGALLFSLAGGLVFFLLDQLGYIASISGFVAIWAAFFGYGLFSGNKNSIKGIIIAAIASVLVMLVANYVCYAYGLYAEAKEAGLSLTFREAFCALPSLIAGEQLVIPHGAYEYYYELDKGVFYKNLVISLLFCALGTFGFIQSTIKKIKMAKASEETQRVDMQ